MARLEELRDKILPILLPYGVKRVAVFGSVARGEDTPESDIDILVELKDAGERPVIGLKWFALEGNLSRILGHPVELVTPRALSPYIRERVSREMVALYDEG
ncbi:MAG: nucleotidyltransferase family protein [Armatimonadota bacterium]|nr:nucleotidyltransferase family protein [Armatimonadota bacterium]